MTKTNESMELAILAKLEESLEAGSLKSLAREAETVMLLIDTSGSMSAHMVNGKTRIQGLREVVRDLKSKGSVPMIAFGGPFDAQVRFVDEVPNPDGGTPLHLAIPMAKEYGATRVVVISDGCPDLREQCMIEARAFGGQIDVVFVGDPGDSGSLFLDELARITGGKRFEGSLTDPLALSGKVILLLEGEVEESKAPIQGAGFTSVEADEPEDDDTDDDEDDEDDTDDEDEDEADEE